MSHALENGIYLDNSAAWEHNALVADRMETLQIQSVSYAPTQIVKKKSIDELWHEQRKREFALVKKLYTTDERIAHKQLCVFVKRDNMHKRLVGIVMYTPRGNVWFDVTQDCEIIPRGTLGYRKVSESIARELVGASDNLKVYLQTFKEVIHEQKHRMQDKRRYHGAMHNAPRDRRVGAYIMPANYGQLINERKEVEQTLEDAYLYRKWG